MILMNRELKKNYKALLIWAFIVGGLVFFLLSMYPDFAAQQQDMREFIKGYPEGMVKAFNLDTIGYETLLGFYSVQGFTMVTLLGSIYTVLLTSSILAKEEEERTIEFLMSKPISRGRIILEKLLAALINITIFNAIVASFTIIAFKKFNTGNPPIDGITIALLIIVGPLILHLTFGALGFLISAFVKKYRNTIAISLGVIMLTYFLSLISAISKTLEGLKFFSPFHYVNTADIILENRIKTVYICIMLGLIIISTYSSYWIFKRKDITA